MQADASDRIVRRLGSDGNRAVATSDRRGIARARLRHRCAPHVTGSGTIAGWSRPPWVNSPDQYRAIVIARGSRWPAGRGRCSRISRTALPGRRSCHDDLRPNEVVRLASRAANVGIAFMEARYRAPAPRSATAPPWRWSPAPTTLIDAVDGVTRHALFAPIRDRNVGDASRTTSSRSI